MFAKCRQPWGLSQNEFRKIIRIRISSDLFTQFGKYRRWDKGTLAPQWSVRAWLRKFQLPKARRYNIQDFIDVKIW